MVLEVKILSASAGDAGWRLQSLGGEDPLRREWQPTLVFLPGESLGQRGLAGVAKSQTELKQPNREQVRQRLQRSPCNLFLKKLSPGSQGQSQTLAVTPRTVMRICSDTEITTSSGKEV